MRNIPDRCALLCERVGHLTEAINCPPATPIWDTFLIPVR